AGSAAAIGFARPGLTVTLFDKARFPRPKACAELLSPGAVAVLDRLSLGGVLGGLDHAAVAGFRLIGPGGASHLLAYPPDGRPRRAAGVRRALLDRALVEAARAAGVDVQEGVAVRGLIRDGERVTGVVARGPRGDREVPAHLVVGADGLGSTVAREVGA